MCDFDKSTTELDQFPSHSRDMVDSYLSSLQDTLFPRTELAAVAGLAEDCDDIKPSDVMIESREELKDTNALLLEEKTTIIAIQPFPNYRDVESSAESDTSLDSDGSEDYFTDEAYLEIEYSDALIEARFNARTVKRNAAIIIQENSIPDTDMAYFTWTTILHVSFH